MAVIRLDKRWTLILGLLLMIAGCRSGAPVSYYTLKAEAVNPPSAGTVGNPGKQMVSIGPLNLPDYIDRPQVVTFEGSNRLEVAEFHRWAGSLRQEMGRVIAENVSILMNTPDVVVYPWDTPRSPGYQVILDFRQIEGRLGQSVNLKVVWWASAVDVPSQRVTRVSDIRVSPSGPGYEALVAAYSQALFSLSREIVDAIDSLPTTAGGAP